VGVALRSSSSLIGCSTSRALSRSLPLKRRPAASTPGTRLRRPKAGRSRSQDPDIVRFRSGRAGQPACGKYARPRSAGLRCRAVPRVSSSVGARHRSGSQVAKGCVVSHPSLGRRQEGCHSAARSRAGRIPATAPLPKRPAPEPGEQEAETTRGGRVTRHYVWPHILMACDLSTAARPRAGERSRPAPWRRSSGGSFEGWSGWFTSTTAKVEVLVDSSRAVHRCSPEGVTIGLARAAAQMLGKIVEGRAPVPLEVLRGGGTARSK
jgi:hypothetical protein